MTVFIAISFRDIQASDIRNACSVRRAPSSRGSAGKLEAVLPRTAGEGMFKFENYSLGCPVLVSPVFGDTGRGLIREQTLAEHPELRPALDALAGKISDAEMRQLNYEVDGNKRDVKEVVRAFLRNKGLQ